MTIISLSDEIFGNEAGEDENIEILQSYFYEHVKFGLFFNLKKKISIISAKKGMGKSTLLSIFDQKLLSHNHKFIIRVTGNNLLGLADIKSTDQAYLENYWKKVICERINIEIGTKIALALNDTNLSLVEFSELNGLKGRNLLSTLLDRLALKISLTSEVKRLPEIDPKSLLKRFQKENKKETVWLLIDDIDSKYFEDEDNRARVGAFFSAIRTLTNEVQGLSIRATVRSDVWLDLSQIEDLDKCDQYITELNWTTQEIKEILCKKISAYINRNYPNAREAGFQYNIHSNELINLFFENPIQWQNKQHSIFDILLIFSNKRPRWLNQICRMAFAHLDETSTDQKIKLAHISAILYKFGEKRRIDLLKEYKHQFADLDKFIDSFRGHQKQYKYDELIRAIKIYFIRERNAEQVGKIKGVEFKDAHDLANFAYQIGLIIQKDDQQFTTFIDNPNLFNSEDNRNNLYDWIVHISLWDYLGLHD